MTLPMQSKKVGTATTSISLTRRGRIVVRALPMAIVLLLSVTALIFSGVFGGEANASNASNGLVVEQYTVAHGETLWQIAGHVWPEADRFDTIRQIGQLNDLDDSSLSVGEVLFVPTSPDADAND